MGTVRLVFRSLWLASLIAFCVPFHLLRRLLGIRSPWPRRFLGWCASAVGMRPIVVGERYRGGPKLYAANHQSWIDILLIGGATGASFVSKEEVKRWPVAGWLATMVGTIYINRKDRGNAVAQALRIREALESGKSVAFFPEGQISGGDLMPFRPALFGAVMPPIPGLAVQPVAVDYGEHAEHVTWRRGRNAGVHAVELMKRKGRTPVTIHLLDPIIPTEASERRDLARDSHDAVARALGQPIDDEAE